MKICIISPGVSNLPLPPVKGGAVENLIDMYLKYNEDVFKDEITVYSCSDSKALEIAKRYKYTKFIYIQTESLRYRVERNVRYLVNKLPHVCVDNAFIRQVKNFNQYDVILVENRPDYGMHFRNNKKVLLHLHNDIIDVSNSRYKIDNSTYSFIITVSNYISKCVTSKLPGANTITLYNGVEITKFFPESFSSKERRELRKQVGIKETEKVIIFSGRLNKDKGVKELVLAFKKIYKKYNLKLVIVGSSIFGKTELDTFTRDLQEIALSCQDAILFTGYIDYQEMPKYYNMADLIVIPSVWNDPSPLTVYESLASGVPLIVSDSGGIPEIVEKSQAIIVKRSEDFVLSLANAIEREVNKDFAYSLPNIEASKRFTVDKYCVELRKIMERVNDISNYTSI